MKIQVHVYRLSGFGHEHINAWRTNQRVANWRRPIFHEILNDEIAKYSAEVAIVTFGGKVEMPLDFASVSSQEIPVLKAKGLTPMGEAVEKAVQLLDLRKDEYRHAGVDYFQPWLILMTDGTPTDSIRKASICINKRTGDKKLAVFAIGVGNDVNMEELGKLCGDRPPLKTKGFRFQRIFLMA